MAQNVIHIFGASGSGTSSLGKKICESLGWFFMDADDYFWLPTDPPFTEKREKAERISLMKKDIAEHENVVISGSITDWGDVLIPYFTLAVRLVADTETRLCRIRRREHERFGSRIDRDGDMYESHLAFVKWASEYDTGDVNMRSRACHDEWQRLLTCKLLTLDATEPIHENVERIIKHLK